MWRDTLTHRSLLPVSVTKLFPRDALPFQASPINQPSLLPLASHEDEGEAPLIFARGDEIILGLSSVAAAVDVDCGRDAGMTRREG